MSRLSLVIFGATGFTGKHAAVEMARIVRKQPDLTWGVAGRSQSKLEDLMRHVAETTGEDQSKAKIIIADVGDYPSLVAMCQQAQVVVNCCGPYRLYGEPVVKAAIQARAHHIDVTGEPQFIESMQLKYDAAAREAGVFIVSACGFDSVPNDMGVAFMQQNFGGTLNSVESYMSVWLPPQLQAEARARGAANVGTWRSLVHGLYHWGELKALRQKLYPARLPPLQPTLLPQRVIHSRGDKWCLPFPGADNSIVYRSQRGRLEAGLRPAQFRAYVALDSLLQALGLLLAAALLRVMCKFAYTRDLLLKYPRFFSGGLVTDEGPSRAVSEASKFKVELYGEGWEEGSDLSGPTNKSVVVRVSGSNPGYGFTVSAALQCALAALRQRERLPGPGGVLTTATAFKDTDLIKNLNENGAIFEIISSKTK